jgi:hypothetical protein
MDEELLDDGVNLRPYRVLLLVESALLLVSIAGCTGVATLEIGPWAILPLILLWLFHVFAIPCFVVYLIWGPVEFHPCAPRHFVESKGFLRKVKQRPELTDREFADQFNVNSAIRSEIATRLRHCLRGILPEMELAMPADHLYLFTAFYGVDGDEILWIVEKEFGIALSKHEIEAMDGTLESLARTINSKQPR